MSDPFVGEIRMFAGNFAPAGWAFCNGQLIPIAENDTLFALIGTTYGGDGQETFGLPDLQGRTPLHAGQGPGLSQNYQLGEKAGVETVTLNLNQIPSHTHQFVGTSSGASANSPAGTVPAVAQGDLYASSFSPLPMSAQAVSARGGSQPHENMQPYLTVNYIISLFGLFPSQT